MLDPIGGTATVGSYYTDFSGTIITIPDGSDSGTASVSVLDDSLFENNELVQAAISSPSDPAITLATATANGVIVDDDNAPGSITASIVATQNGAETGSVSIAYQVTLSKINYTHSPISFNVATSGTAENSLDYTGLASTISVPHGSNTATITLAVVDDTLFENTEGATLTISSPSDPTITIGTSSATANIIDDDNGVGTVIASLDVQSDGDETGPTSIVYRATLSKVNNTHGDISFEMNQSGGSATVGSDYTDFDELLLSVPHGSATGTLIVPVINDSLFENNETVAATMSNSSDPAISIGT